jgi:alkylhydroperoxidase family enzyme
LAAAHVGDLALADLAVAVNSNPQLCVTVTSRGCAISPDDHEILEGISIVAFIGATNRIGIALSVPPNAEYTGIPTGQGRPSE